MKLIRTLVCSGMIAVLVSCDNASRGGYGYDSDRDMGGGYTAYEDADELYDDMMDEYYGSADESVGQDIGQSAGRNAGESAGQGLNIRLTGEIVPCNKCMGYGMVQDGLYGQPEICKFCWVSTYMRMQQGWTGFDGRYGMVDAVFNTLPANYFDELDWNADAGDSDYGNSGGYGYGGNGSGGYNGGGYSSGGVSSEQIEREIARHEENIALIEHQLEYMEGTINRTYLEQQLIEERYEVRRLKSLLNGM